MWHWGGTDRYFCSRSCHLDRLIKHLGGEEKAGRYIDNNWFRRSEFTELCQDIEQAGDELLDKLEELKDVINE